MPTPKLYYTLNNSTYDISSKYTYSYAVTSGFSVNNNTITSSLKSQNGTGTLTITATPKDDNAKAMLGSDPIVTNIDLKSTYRTEKIKTYITFAKHEQDALRFRNMSGEMQNNTLSPNLIIEDEFGNDISSIVFDKRHRLNVQYSPMNVFKDFSTDPLDNLDHIRYTRFERLKNDHTSGGIGYCGTYGTEPLRITANYHNRPDDYLITVTAYDDMFGKDDIYEKPVPYSGKSYTVPGQFYQENNNNQYTLTSNQYILRVHKRVPDIVLSPDPSKITIAKGMEMSEFNRFKVTAVIHDNYESTDPDQTLTPDYPFYYFFFVPDKYKYDESKTEEENEAAAQAAKHGLIRVVKATQKSDPDMIIDMDTYVPMYNADGTLALDGNGNQKKELLHGTSYFSMYGWGNESFKITFYGNGLQVPIVYMIVFDNTNSFNVGTSSSYSFHVADREPTHFVIDPKQQVTGVGGTVPCPSIAVHDQFEADVTSLFTVTRAKKTTGAYTLNDDGSVTSNTAGNYDVTVSGKLADANSTTSLGRFFSNPADDDYTAVFKQSSTGSIGAYEIIYDDKEFSTDAATQAASKMGKLHFITAGDFFPGTISYGEVPGINITFGDAKDVDNVWTITPSTEESPVDNDNDLVDGKISKKYISGNTVIINESTGLPDAGCFLKIDAITNGWLTLGCKFLSHSDKPDLGPEHYILKDASTKEEQSHSESKDLIREYTFPKPLLAGHTYYLYTDDGNMMLHGVRYTPGFIDPVTDKMPWKTPGAVDNEPMTLASTYMNGYTGALPTLAMGRQNERVSWHVLDVPAGSTSTSVDDIKELTNDDAKHAFVGEKDGRIYAEKMTSERPLTDESRKNSDAYGRVRVFAKVLGQKKADGKQVMKQPGYWLFVGDLPTYIVKEGESHSQDDRVSTTNIPTRIWMTFGGWHWSQAEEYPYYKNNDQTKDWVEDGWKTAKMDSVGRNNQTIDGFQFVTWGEQNPTDELVRSWDKGKRNTFNLPVRGTYLKFEPEESGLLLVYLVQNGMTDNAKGNDAATLKNNGPWLRRRAVYIVDETGHPVAIDDFSGWDADKDWNKYVNAGTTNADRYEGYHNWRLNYFCDGVTRCAWKYDGTNELAISKANPATTSGNEAKYSWFKAYDRNGDAQLSKEEQANLDADAKKIKDWWTAPSYSYSNTIDGKTLSSSLDHAKLDGPLEVIQLSDSSYVLPTKGYVRYTFRVDAGKVYYVFATGSKLGFCGFGFLPTGFSYSPQSWTDKGTPNEYGEFSDEVYASLPQPGDKLYTTGGVGNDRLMGGSTTLDVSKKANETGSYADFHEKGFTIDGETKGTAEGANRDFIDVTLQRSFRNRRWAGICLPFTVSESQMKRIFGDDMQLITVDSVMAAPGHERTLHFTQHVNQLCEAGRPYFIYPNVSGIEAGQSIGSSLTFEGVTFEGVDTATVVMYNEAVVDHNAKPENANSKIDIFTYRVTGTYNKSLIPWMSYYMKNSQDESANKLYRIVPAEGATAKGAYLPGCNAYLFPYSTDAEGKNLVATGDKAKIAQFWITGAEVSGGSTTGIDELIDEINEQATVYYPGVYDLQGHCVSTGNSLKGLPSGVYIMGGKKYVVK